VTAPIRYIRRTIAEVLEGISGTTVRVGANLFKRGTFEGQQLPAKQTAVLDGSHAFDVVIRNLRDHPATPVSALTTQPIQWLSVTIPIWTHLTVTADGDDRDDVIARVMQDGDDACAALGHPHNLDAALSGHDTDIVSGLMLGPDGTGTPDFEIVSEDWDSHWVRSQITGSLIVSAAA
jgi:hypothetical protein